MHGSRSRPRSLRGISRTVQSRTEISSQPPRGARLADLASKLRSTTTIRERCGNILAAADAGQSRHFTVQRSRLEAAAQLVEQVTRRQYP
ncbi:DUF1688 family protein, partial [Ideonella azotifigens]|uniref:DUF1688 family protein n=1 Tax=Ideonella azotifigens TaxID=513160 RepID=UPI0011416B55